MTSKLVNRTVVWFRRDLRVSDHAPLYRAARRGLVIPIFVLDRALLHHPETSVARVTFMLNCLDALDQDLRQRGGRLIIRSGDPVQILPQLVEETQADGIYAYTDCERIYGRVRDARLNQALQRRSLKIRWFEPTASTSSLMVYPNFRQYWFAEMDQPMAPTPSRLDVPADINSESLPTLRDLELIPDGKPIPPGGSTVARQYLQDFLNEKCDRYYWQLSYPSAEATTGLSPYLKFGVISIRECYQTAKPIAQSADKRVQRSVNQLISRLRWGSGFTQRFRYFPQLELRSLYPVFDDEGWLFDDENYHRWQQGQTGFPIVDAAARCLQTTGGWKALNFRVRAIYASFLSNLLGMDWRLGALHFMRHLIDGDCPIDHYQWAMQAGVTHCLDKSWTRIYHPGQLAVDRCDPDGVFIKQWLPELAHLPATQLGEPPTVQGYPSPMLDYQTARQTRIQMLEQQRQTFRQQNNVLPYLASLPDNVTPFGSDRVPCDVSWATQSNPDLFPPPLDLAALSEDEAIALRTWLVAHVNIKPPKTPRKKTTSRVQEDSSVYQLRLFS